jgi:lysophospholipase L1-like esterase
MTRIRMLCLALAAGFLLLPGAAQAAKPPKRFYVSLGDSYATGYQVLSADGTVRDNTRNGFAYQIPKLAAKRGYNLKLVNFGCGGATTTSMLEQTAPCSNRVFDGHSWGGKTQIAAAEKFLRAHRGKVALITVSIGGNDVTACAKQADPFGCVAAATQSIKENVTEAAVRLRAAAGKKVKIVGTTYPDVILGGWVGENPNQGLAQASVPAFKALINPTLKAAYAEAKGGFADVTEATGAYTPLDQTTTLAPYGVIPVAVAKICELTYYCQFRDIHSKTEGYKVIAKLVTKQLPEHTRR